MEGRAARGSRATGRALHPRADRLGGERRPVLLRAPPPLAAACIEGSRQDGGEESWIYYDTTKFSGKKLVVRPGWLVPVPWMPVSTTSRLVRQRHLRRGPRSRVATPALDELLVTHDRAVRGVEVRNTGPEDLVAIKFFGPDVNPDVPMIERRRRADARCGHGRAGALGHPRDGQDRQDPRAARSASRATASSSPSAAATASARRRLRRGVRRPGAPRQLRGASSTTPPSTSSTWRRTTRRTRSGRSAAADAGKHVLCEKPLAVRHADAVEIVEAARRNDVFLLEAFAYRCHPQTQRLVELLRSERSERCGSIDAVFGYDAGPEPTNYLMDPELAGGSILDVGCYTDLDGAPRRGSRARGRVGRRRRRDARRAA